MFPNLVANDYKSHVVVNGVVTFWLISTSDNILFDEIDTHKKNNNLVLAQVFT